MFLVTFLLVLLAILASTVDSLLHQPYGLGLPYTNTRSRCMISNRNSNRNRNGQGMHEEKNRQRSNCSSSMKASVTSFLSLDGLKIDRQSLLRACIAMFFISAPLGSLLDNYHGLFGVLSYNPSALPYQLYNPLSPDQVIVKSAAFVGPLFGLAGVVMSFLQLLLDATLDTPVKKTRPSWPFTFSSIGFFALQYYLSGLLDYMGFSNQSINVVLLVYCLIGWWVYDNSKAGFALGILTGTTIMFYDIYTFYMHGALSCLSHVRCFLHVCSCIRPCSGVGFDQHTSFLHL